MGQRQVVSWSVPFALTLAGILAGAGAVTLGATRASHGWARRAGDFAVPYLLAAAAMIGLYALWQFVLDLLVVHTAGAIGRGRDIAVLEQHLHLPSEASLQRLALHAPWLVHLANRYYADVDFPGLCACLLWLFARHRDRFIRYLAPLVVITAICAFIQAVPVAPPRLVPGFGFLDTGAMYHQLVYSPGADQPGVLTTMPSVHVAWAAWVAIAAVGAGRGRWRWVWVAHPVLTVLVVVVTGNHFWLDGAAALGIVAVVFAGEGLVLRFWGRRRPPPPTGTPAQAADLEGSALAVPGTMPG
jgi:hypothetical protein